MLDEKIQEQLIWSTKRTAHCHRHIDIAMGSNGKHGYRLPSVGVAVSGGGHRAMLSFAAAMDVMKAPNADRGGVAMLDTVTTMAGLSGGSWGLVEWLAAQKEEDDMPLPQRERQVRRFPCIVRAAVGDPWSMCQHVF